MKTEAELQKLKLEWKRDPIWDIEDTEGFEEHRQELKSYRIKQEKIWQDNLNTRLVAKSKKIGAPNNIDLVKYLNGLEHRIDSLQQQVCKLQESLNK